MWSWCGAGSGSGSCSDGDGGGSSSSSSSSSNDTQSKSVLIGHFIFSISGMKFESINFRLSVATKSAWRGHVYMKRWFKSQGYSVEIKRETTWFCFCINMLVERPSTESTRQAPRCVSTRRNVNIIFQHLKCGHPPPPTRSTSCRYWIYTNP
jgi:hypothetical protein